MIDPSAFGKRLKLLGFASEPRDARGKKLRLTEAASNLAQQVIRNFGGPEVGDGPASKTVSAGNEGLKHASLVYLV